MVTVLALNGLNGEFPPNLVKPKIIKLEFAVSPLSTQQNRVRALKVVLVRSESE
jgi:hypothetical protein